MSWEYALFRPVSRLAVHLQRSKNDSEITIKAHEGREEGGSIIGIRTTVAITQVGVGGETHL